MTSDSSSANQKLADANQCITQTAHDRNIDSPVQSCNQEKDWLEFELLNESDEGVADQRFTVTSASDKSILHKGKTDANGFVRLDGLTKREYKICFPDLDENAWEEI